MSNEQRQPKIYAPASLKEIEFTGGGKLLKLSVNVDKFMEFLKEHETEKGWVNMKIERRREPGQYGDTHSLLLDTWKPDWERRESAPPRSESKPPDREDYPVIDEPPF